MDVRIASGRRRLILKYLRSMAPKFTTSIYRGFLGLFRTTKKLAECAIAQVTDEQLFAVGEEANSIGIDGACY